jgi:hypothetical protein
MQILPTSPAVIQPPTAAVPLTPLPSDRSTVAEPARRVTPNRDSGKADLQTQRNRRSEASGTRGRALDLSV